VRLHGPFRWAIAIRDRNEAEEFEEALNDLSTETLACLTAVVGARRVRPQSHAGATGE